MNYTENYRKVYEQVTASKVISHEEAHNISLRITDALSNLSLIIKDNPTNVSETVKHLVTKIVEK